MYIRISFRLGEIEIDYVSQSEKKFRAIITSNFTRIQA